MKIHRAPPPENILTREELDAHVAEFLNKQGVMTPCSIDIKPPIICIVGSTASGKTSLSIDLAKKYNGEVINMDSRQFYTGMDIGTAKITEEEMDGVPHHLLSFLTPDEEFPVAECKDAAEKIMTDIHSRGKIPFLVGGSGLFVDAIRKNFSIPRIPPQSELRKELEKLPPEELYEKLQKVDPEAAKNIEQNNMNRIIRALEVYEITGEKISQLQEMGKKKWNDLLIGVWMDPEKLLERIENRTESIWNSGFLDEVQALIDAGYTEESPGMIAHGYREAMAYLKGEISEEEAKYLMNRNTKRYAKRQRTWWRREEEMVWVQP